MSIYHLLGLTRKISIPNYRLFHNILYWVMQMLRVRIWAQTGPVFTQKPISLTPSRACSLIHPRTYKQKSWKLLLFLPQNSKDLCQFIDLFLLIELI